MKSGYIHWFKNLFKSRFFKNRNTLIIYRFYEEVCTIKMDK